MVRETETPAKAKFTTTLLQAGKTATGIHIPDKIIEQFNAGKKPPVAVTVNGYTYRSTVAVMGGNFMVGVSADVREKAGVRGGEKINVKLELDTRPREVLLPQDFKRALDKNAVAKKTFESLSYTKKKGYVLPVEQAKTQETRRRRIEKAISELSR